jgi:hypothetical protein
MVGALSVARGERLAAGADWSPYRQRQALVSEVHAVRSVARATRRHHEPPSPAHNPALGLAYPGGDLYPWLRQHGQVIEVVIPEREQRLAMAVLGIPGSGKTVTPLRRVWIAARAGMRVIFVDCKGTDPGLAWQVTCTYRLANPGAIVGFWPTQPLDCWRGDGMAIANRLLAVEDWASEGGGVYYRRMATLAIQLACTPPSGPPRSSQDFLRRLDIRKLQQLWRGDQAAQADLEQLAADPQVAGRGAGPLLGLLPRPPGYGRRPLGPGGRGPGRAVDPNHRQPHRRRRRCPPGPGGPGAFRHPTQAQGGR